MPDRASYLTNMIMDKPGLRQKRKELKDSGLAEIKPNIISTTAKY
jgi:hypothetical protein